MPELDQSAPPIGLRTTISIAVPLPVGHFSNEWNGMPREDFSASGPGVLTATSLGSPNLMIQRVVRECGKR